MMDLLDVINLRGVQPSRSEVGFRLSIGLGKVVGPAVSSRNALAVGFGDHHQAIRKYILNGKAGTLSAEQIITIREG